MAGCTSFTKNQGLRPECRPLVPEFSIRVGRIDLDEPFAIRFHARTVDGPINPIDREHVRLMTFQPLPWYHPAHGRTGPHPSKPSRATWTPSTGWSSNTNRPSTTWPTASWATAIRPATPPRKPSSRPIKTCATTAAAPLKPGCSASSPTPATTSCAGASAARRLLGGPHRRREGPRRRNEASLVSQDESPEAHAQRKRAVARDPDLHRRPARGHAHRRGHVRRHGHGLRRNRPKHRRRPGHHQIPPVPRPLPPARLFAAKCVGTSAARFPSRRGKHIAMINSRILTVFQPISTISSPPIERAELESRLAREPELQASLHRSPAHRARPAATAGQSSHPAVLP